MKRVVFTHRLIKKEKLSQTDIDVVIKSCKKGIFTPLKGVDIPSETSLIKIYVTTIQGARRIALLLDEEIGVAHFLFFRKKDDPIGKNMSIKNPVFKKTLKQYLQLWELDVKDDNFDIFELI